MKKTRYSESHIVKASKEVEGEVAGIDKLRDATGNAATIRVAACKETPGRKNQGAIAGLR
jgi:hypothetical protein